MKKKVIAIVALVMSLFMGISVFSGCDLITTNNERDLQQTVATVNVDKTKFEDAKILKQDMIMGYLNYGYSYAQSGYTQSQIFESFLDNLINNRILVQVAMLYMEENQVDLQDGKTAYTLDRYLTADEVVEAEYNTVKSMNDLIDSYEEAEETLKKDTLSEEVRTAPTDAKKEEKELSIDEKKDYIDPNKDGGILKGTLGDDRNKAYNKVLKVLKVNGLLGESATDIEGSEYYNDVLVGQKESVLIEKYEDKQKEILRSNITFSALESQYVAMYNKQEGSYANDNKAFAEALSSATKDSPILYNVGSGSYGYVYNLLLGANDDQVASINAIKTTDIDARNEQRNKILWQTTATDLRSTWIYSGYDFDITTKKFTGDYAFTENSLPFKGSVTELTLPDTVDQDAKEYKINALDEFVLSNDLTADKNLLKVINDYLGIVDSDIVTATANSDPAVLWAKKNATIDEYDEKINELLFAFSTDPGSLNTYKGYVIEDAPDFDGKDQWVIEFANAGRKLLEEDLCYIMVASDYGFHILFYSELVSVSNNHATLVDYLNSLDSSVTDWSAEYTAMLSDWETAEEEDSYLYKLASACGNVDTRLNRIENDVVKKYKNNKDHVVKYEKAYANLMQN